MSTKIISMTKNMKLRRSMKTPPPQQSLKQCISYPTKVSQQDNNNDEQQQNKKKKQHNKQILVKDNSFIDDPQRARDEICRKNVKKKIFKTLEREYMKINHNNKKQNNFKNQRSQSEESAIEKPEVIIRRENKQKRKIIRNINSILDYEFKKMGVQLHSNADGRSIKNEVRKENMQEAMLTLSVSEYEQDRIIKTKQKISKQNTQKQKMIKYIHELIQTEITGISIKPPEQILEEQKEKQHICSSLIAIIQAELNGVAIKQDNKIEEQVEEKVNMKNDITKTNVDEIANNRQVQMKQLNTIVTKTKSQENIKKTIPKINEPQKVNNIGKQMKQPQKMVKKTKYKQSSKIPTIVQINEAEITKNNQPKIQETSKIVQEVKQKENIKSAITKINEAQISNDNQKQLQKIVEETKQKESMKMAILKIIEDQLANDSQKQKQPNKITEEKKEKQNMKYSIAQIIEEEIRREKNIKSPNKIANEIKQKLYLKFAIAKIIEAEITNTSQKQQNIIEQQNKSNEQKQEKLDDMKKGLQNNSKEKQKKKQNEKYIQKATQMQKQKETKKANSKQKEIQKTKQMQKQKQRQKQKQIQKKEKQKYIQKIERQNKKLKQVIQALNQKLKEIKIDSINKQQCTKGNNQRFLSEKVRIFPATENLTSKQNNKNIKQGSTQLIMQQQPRHRNMTNYDYSTQKDFESSLSKNNTHQQTIIPKQKIGITNKRMKSKNQMILQQSKSGYIGETHNRNYIKYSNSIDNQFSIPNRNGIPSSKIIDNWKSRPEKIIKNMNDYLKRTNSQLLQQKRTIQINAFRNQQKQGRSLTEASNAYLYSITPPSSSIKENSPTYPKVNNNNSRIQKRHQFEQSPYKQQNREKHRKKASDERQQFPDITFHKNSNSQHRQRLQKQYRNYKDNDQQIINNFQLKKSDASTSQSIPQRILQDIKANPQILQKSLGYLNKRQKCQYLKKAADQIRQDGFSKSLKTKLQSIKSRCSPNLINNRSIIKPNFSSLL